MKYKDNKEYFRRKGRDFYWKNKEKLSIKKKTHYLKNKEEINKKHREYYGKTKERAKERAKRWRKKNPEKVRRMNREERKRSPEKVKAREYAKKHNFRSNYCFKCGSDKDLHFHHIDYKKNIGITLCRTCHNKLHKLNKIDERH